MTAEDAPIHEIAYDVPRSGGGVERISVPVVRAAVDVLSDGLEAILATSDLQGREADDLGGAGRLASELVAEELEVLCDVGVLPARKACGVLLAGDLWAREGLDRRGGHGDIGHVLDAWASRFRWVCVVPGNHDELAPGSLDALASERPGLRFLDGSSTEVDGLRVAGLGGVVGNPRRPFRRTEPDFESAVRSLLADRPDVLLLHEGPDAPGLGLPGRESIRKALQGWRSLAVFGHKFWSTALVETREGAQLLNVNSRVVVCLPAATGSS